MKARSDHAPAWIVLREAGSLAPEALPRVQRSARGRRDRRTALDRAAPPARRPLLVIDGDLFAHRSYHALPKNILRKGRKPAGAILGFANMLLRLYREEQPACGARRVGERQQVPNASGHEKLPAYQSGREFDDAVVEQLEVLPDFVAACGFQNAKAPGFEADDFLAAAAAKEVKAGGVVLVASGDRDTFQPASDRTTILYPVRAGEMARVGPAEVRARYGVDPSKFPILSRLRGDPSDKVPGAPGVGAAGAATLLQRYGSLGSRAQSGAVSCNSADETSAGFTGRSPTDGQKRRRCRSFCSQMPSWDKAAALASQWELQQLARRLKELASG